MSKPTDKENFNLNNLQRCVRSP